MKQKIISYRGYHKYYKLPEKFETINKKKDTSYKKWREKKTKLLDSRIKYLSCELFWKSLNNKEKEDMIKKYKTADIAKQRYWRWTEPMGYKTKTSQNIEVLEKKFKNLK